MDELNVDDSVRMIDNRVVTLEAVVVFVAGTLETQL